jgi:hypothetical protein
MLPGATATKPRRARYVCGVELQRVDGRTLAARRYRTLIEAFTLDLGGKLSEAEGPGESGGRHPVRASTERRYPTPIGR